MFPVNQRAISKKGKSVIIAVRRETRGSLVDVNFFVGSAEQNAKHGAADKVQAKMNAMKDRMTLREKNKPEMFELLR